MNTLTVGGFSRACIAVLSAAVTLTACGSHEEQKATPVATRQLTLDHAPPAAHRPFKDWVTDQLVQAEAPYEGICLADLYAPGTDGAIANFVAVGLADPNAVIGIITGTAGAMPDSGRFGIAIVPANGVGSEFAQFNVDVETANKLLREHGICR